LPELDSRFRWNDVRRDFDATLGAAYTGCPVICFIATSQKG
jgi:hypothetical protein